MSIAISMPEATKQLRIMGKRSIDDPTITGKSGVYVFKDAEDTVLYVGKSKDVNRRISEHLSVIPSPFEGRAHTVTIYLEANPVFVDIYEAYIIDQLNPAYNKAGMYSAEFQLLNEDSWFELEAELAELLDEERALKRYISDQEEAITYEEFTDTAELIDTFRDLGRVRRRIAIVKREIGIRKRRSYKAVAA